MRRIGGPFHGCLVGAMVLAGCSKGIENDTSALTFGPIDDTSAGSASATTGPVDLTTSGQGPLDDSGDGTTSMGPATDGPATTDPGTTGSVDPDTGGTTATTDPGTSTGMAGPVCGDGLAEPGEECDGDDLTGLTCPDVDAMFTGGTLACDPACALDTSGCTMADNPIVVCQAVGGAISDNSTLSDTITLAPGDLGGTITDVDVEVELDHTWIGDLDIDITSGGTNVLLFDTCGSEDNLHVTFDDSGGALSCASSDINATVQPSGTLSSFNGDMVVADWTLDVSDGAGGDTGTLTQWCVTISWM